MKNVILFYLTLIVVGVLSGCSFVGDVRQDVYAHSMKVFDDVEYRYHRKGNEITRELMATGTEKITPEDNLNVPGVSLP